MTGKLAVCAALTMLLTSDLWVAGVECANTVEIARMAPTAAAAMATLILNRVGFGTLVLLSFRVS
jgi:hypothetical protein